MLEVRTLVPRLPLLLIIRLLFSKMPLVIVAILHANIANEVKF